MREILFKAKRIDNGEWIQGYYYQIWEQGYILWGMTNNVPNMIEVDSTTLCQYTGFTDKNDKRIWENDILCGRLDEEYPENITYKKVVWDMNGFCTKEECSTDLEQLDEFDTEYFEVCGDIFDNAELLEE